MPGDAPTGSTGEAIRETHTNTATAFTTACVTSTLLARALKTVAALARMEAPQPEKPIPSSVTLRLQL